MSGPIGLHGGGEYLDGDEPFLDALIAAARGAATARVNGGDQAAATLRIVILPTAAARGRPDKAAAIGTAALTARAEGLGRPVPDDVASCWTPRRPSAWRTWSSWPPRTLHLPGGDPISCGVLAGTPYLAAIGPRPTGAVIAGASAGGMAWPSVGTRRVGFAVADGAGLAPFAYDGHPAVRLAGALDRWRGRHGYLGSTSKRRALDGLTSGGRRAGVRPGAGTGSPWRARANGRPHGETIGSPTGPLTSRGVPPPAYPPYVLPRLR